MLSTWTQIERLLNDPSLGTPVFPAIPTTRAQDTSWPLVDVLEDADAVTLVADLPGVSKDDISLTMVDRHLTLSGERSMELAQNVTVRRRERQAVRFSRRFDLGLQLDASGAEATFNDGVLTLRIPKAEAARPLRIEVR